MKLERLRIIENIKKCSSAMDLTITTGCSWNMALFPSAILMLVFMSQEVGTSFVMVKIIFFPFRDMVECVFRYQNLQTFLFVIYFMLHKADLTYGF